MPAQPLNHPAHDALQPFLYADIGPERSGMTLSVLSALARLDVDPWEEAARLAKLPRATAAAMLARMIASTPTLCTTTDAPRIASRLAALLPQTLTRPVQSASAELLPEERRWLVPAGLLATLLFGLLLSVGFQDKRPLLTPQATSDQVLATGG
jgi:hypothetical protein